MSSVRASLPRAPASRQPLRVAGLQEAARYFSPNSNPNNPRPLRILWDVLGDAVAGAFTANVAGGTPLVGAMVGGVEAGIREVAKALPDSPDALLRRGAFDLAARVRRGIMNAEPMPTLLSRFLTRAEKEKLGL